MLNTKEFYDLMAQFEKDAGHYNFEKENKKMFCKQVYYCNGEVNNLFKMYFMGYQSAKCMARLGYFD